MIAGLLAALGGHRFMRRALHFGLSVAAIFMLLMACRRSGERLGRLLEQAGVIERYVALLDPAKVGMGLTLFVRVGLLGQDQETVEAFVEAVRKLPQVVECHLMTGHSDFLRPRRIPSLSNRAHLARIDGVRNIKTEIPMQQIKHSWEVPV